MKLLAGPLLWSLIQDVEWAQPRRFSPDGAVVVFLLAGLLAALLLDRLRR